MSPVEKPTYPSTSGLSLLEITAVTTLARSFRQALHTNQLIKQAVKLIAQMCRYPCLNLFLQKDKTAPLTWQSGLWDNTIPPKKDVDTFLNHLSYTNSVINQVLQSGKPALSPHPGYTVPAGMTGIMVEWGVPLLFQEQVIGVLHRFSRSPVIDASSELAILEAISYQLGLALDTLHLQETIQRRTVEQQSCLEITGILASTQPVEQILAITAQKITTLLKADGCSVFQWQPHDRFSMVAEYISKQTSPQPQSTYILRRAIATDRDPLARRLQQNQHPLVLYANSPTESARIPTLRLSLGWQQMLVLPIHTPTKKSGWIELYRQKERLPFNQDDVQLLKVITQQLAPSIEQNFEIQQVRQRLAEVSTLYSFSRQLTSVSTVNLDHLLDEIVNTMRQIVDCRACVLFLLNEDQKYLEIKAAAGLKDKWRQNARLAIGEGAAGQAVKQKKIIYIPDTTQDSTYIFFDRSVRSIIVAPMIVHDQVVGAINLDDTEPDAFTQVQEQLLIIAAAHAAIAVQNATLLTQAVAKEKHTRAIIQNMADGLLMLDQNGTIVRVNPALSLMIGLPPEKIIGQNVQANGLDARLTAICTPLATRLRSGVLTGETTLPPPHSSTLRIFASTVSGENTRPIGEVRVVHDITQERRLEQMKDDFISIVSHELRTPLFSIQGFVRLMLDEQVPNPHNQREFLTIIERQTNQLSQLVANLLDLNKIAQGTFGITKHPTQILEVITHTITQIQGFAHQKKVTVTHTLPLTLPLIMGDTERLEQVMTNLIGNAIKFTPIDGTVTVKARLKENRILISIADTGIGIAPQNLERIFSKFYQVEEHNTRSSSGSGLGLHICKQLIEMHHGTIWAESKLGSGSTFFVQLPLAGTL